MSQATDNWVIMTNIFIQSWLIWCMFFLCACFCLETQRGAEGGNGLANGSANFLRDHRQHVLLWWWVLWAWKAVLTIGTLHQHYFLWHQHQYWKWYKNHLSFFSVCLKFHNQSPLSLCSFRSIWWWVGGGIEQRWVRHGSRRNLWWRVQAYVSTVFISWDSWGLN